MKHRQKMLLLGKCFHFRLLFFPFFLVPSSLYTTFNYAADVN